MTSDDKKLLEIERLTLDNGRRLSDLEDLAKHNPGQSKKRSAVLRFPNFLGPPTEFLSLLTLLGLLVFASAWISIRSFYRPFRIMPEEVGFSYSILLSRTTSILGLLVIFYIAVALMATYYRDRIVKSNKEPLHARRLAIGTVFLLAVGALVQAVGQVFTSFSIGALVVYWGAIFIAIGICWLAYYSRRRTGDPKQDGEDISRFVAGFSIFATVCLLVLPLSLLARRTSQEIYNGEPTNKATGYFTLFVGITHSIVDVKWIQGQPAADIAEPLMYFGQSNDVIVLYDSTNNHVYRVSSQNVVLTHRV